MNIFCSIFLIHFILAKVSGLYPTGDNAKFEKSANKQGCTSLPSDLKINIITESGSHEQLNLKQTNQLLANQHLPIWITTGVVNEDNLKDENVGNLKLKSDVMDQLGKFTMYQESESTSAAVYFHKHCHFDGIIDSRYVIQGLSIDDIDSTKGRELIVDKSAIVTRKNSLVHPYRQKMEKEGSITPGGGGLEDVKKRKNPIHINNGYPEILVIVSCELGEELMKPESNNNKYTSITSYVLTLFNGVDMLYSKLKTKIELNIAGIIIESECGSLAFLKRCHNQIMDHHGNTKQYMDAECSIRYVSDYLLARKKVIPPDSYDIAVLLTKYDLYIMDSENGDNGEKYKNEYLAGLSDPCYNLYECKKTDEPIVLMTTLNDDGHFKNFAVTAHEMAHLMTVKHDDLPFSLNEECCAKIMKNSDAEFWCKKCLTWSDMSEKYFERFFSSPDCCAFINKPRSLHVPWPRQMLTVNEQCQCYGHKSAFILNGLRPSICNARMMCTTDDKDNPFHMAPIPMDGTPCGQDKVCWNRKCETIGAPEP